MNSEDTVMNSEGRDLTKLVAGVAYSLCALLIVAGLGLLLAALLAGYRTADGQSALTWATSVLAIGSVGGIVVLLLSRAKARRGRGPS